MNLYLMQHGRPVPKDQDPSRPLSRPGEADARRVGAYLRHALAGVREVLHSGKRRARETAEIVCDEVRSGTTPQERPGLGPMDDVQLMAKDIEKRTEDLMIVGHLPYLSKLVSFLITGKESPPLVQFQQGAVVCLCPAEEGRGWSVSWMIVPELIPGGEG